MCTSSIKAYHMLYAPIAPRVWTSRYSLLKYAYCLHSMLMFYKENVARWRRKLNSYCGAFSFSFLIIWQVEHRPSVIIFYNVFFYDVYAAVGGSQCLARKQLHSDRSDFVVLQIEHSAWCICQTCFKKFYVRNHEWFIGAFLMCTVFNAMLQNKHKLYLIFQFAILMV